MINSQNIWNMKLALEQAEKALKDAEVPIGAVIVDDNNQVIAAAGNLKESAHDPTGHAELIAIKEAAKKLGNWRLLNCDLYVTLEPCPMCLSAILQSRIRNVYFGAYDPKGGALSLGYHFHSDERLNHKFNITGGVMHFDCSKLISDFFRQRRSEYKASRTYKS